MRGAGVRVEALRFMLLIVLTVALASVAFRINSHSSSTSSQPRPRVPAAGPQSPSSAPGGNPTVPASSPAPRHPGHPQTTGGGGNGSGSRSGSGTGTAGSGGAGTPAQLPVTGWDPAMKLGAFAFVLIGGGMLSIRSAGPSRRRQRVSVQD